MFSRFRRFPLLGVIAVVVLLGGVLVGAAIANDNGDVFYACEKDGNIVSGSVMVNQEPKCNGNKTLVSWNSEGPHGPQGPPGGVLGFYYLFELAQVPPTIGLIPTSIILTCDAGDMAVGGGTNISIDFLDDVELRAFGPLGGFSSTSTDIWFADFVNRGTGTAGVSATATCADFAPEHVGE